MPKTGFNQIKGDRCPSCGRRYVEHLGLIGTCKELEKARSALKVIHTWATFEGGIALDPSTVAKLCEKNLKADKCQPKS